MGAKQDDERNSDDAGVELPLVVWAEEAQGGQEPQTPRGRPEGSPDAEAAAASARATGAGAPIHSAAGNETRPEAQTPPVSDSDAAADIDSGADAGAGIEEETAAQADRLGLLEEAVEADGEPDPAKGVAHHRISRPMVAAAAFGGVALVGLSVLFAQMGGQSGGPAGARLSGSAVFPHSTLGPGLPASSAAGLLPLGGTPTRSAPAGAASSHTAVPHGGSGSAGSGHTSGSSSTSSNTNTGAGTGSSKKSGAGVASAPPAATFDAVGGGGCSGSGTSFSTYGWYDDGESGYLSVGSGGLDGDGCNGSFVALPMSGDANIDDGNYMLWTFHTGSVGSGSCAVDVYIPNVDNTVEVGGDPSYYTVQDSAAAGSDTVGSFSVDQTSNLGRWAYGGTFRVSGGVLAVMLHSRGIDWTATASTDAHHAADAIKVSCKA